MTNTEMLAELLSEGLDLCIRGRELDAQVMRALEAGMGRIFDGSTRCATPEEFLDEEKPKPPDPQSKPKPKK